MKKLLLTGLFIAASFTSGIASEPLVSKIEFASVDEANRLLQQKDEFTESWSQFDINSRMHKQNSTKEELFDFITEQTRAWSFDEENKIRSAAESIDEQINEQGFTIDFPNEIYFVKTTGNEEGGAAGYTRANYIVLNEDILSQPEVELKQIIVHELLHILTRANPDFRKEMYEIIGFKIMNQIDYPSGLKKYRITNPDAPQTDSYITLQVEEESVECMMILYSKEEYSGGEFFEYLNVGFLSLTGDEEKSIEYENGEPIIYEFNQVEGFFEKVGQNTQYIIHPEEIVADNFAFAVLNATELSNPEIVNEIKRKLKE